MNNLSKIIKFIKANNKNTIFSTLGIKIKSYNPDDVILTIATDKRHLQHTGLIHGGVYLILSESAASIAAALKVNPFKYSILGMEIRSS